MSKNYLNINDPPLETSKIITKFLYDILFQILSCLERHFKINWILLVFLSCFRHAFNGDSFLANGINNFLKINNLFLENYFGPRWNFMFMMILFLITYGQLKFSGSTDEKSCHTRNLAKFRNSPSLTISHCIQEDPYKARKENTYRAGHLNDYNWKAIRPNNLNSGRNSR